MSAFVVGFPHIHALLRFALADPQNPRLFYYWQGAWHEISHENATETGQMVLDENVRSVAYRYPEDVTGPIFYLFKRIGAIPTPVQALKFIACLEYQSCEHPEWEASKAAAFLEALKDTAISRLPGYEAALWESEEPDTPVITHAPTRRVIS